jgi:hypothetical protein
MGNAFTQVDWDLVQTRAGSVGAQLRAKGAEVWDFEPLPPVPRAQLEEFTRKTRIVFPSDFVDLVTNFAGGWNFSWCLFETKTGKWLKSPVFMGNFGGNAEVPFIGASTDETLLDRYESFQDEIRNSIHNRNSCLEDSETLRLLPALFPLHTCDGSGGDYTVLRLDVAPAKVYYLDHELAWPLDDEHTIGIGFREFVLGWANLGFPQCEYHSCWVNPQTRQPADTSREADVWRGWLIVP